MKICHDNLGHPLTPTFAKILKLGGARPEVVIWVKRHFKCEACEAGKHPKAKRVTAVPRTYRFNHIVGVDLVEVKCPLDNQNYFWINIVCWGTQYQQVKCLLNDGRKTAENVFQTYTDAWTRIFGPPEVLVCDPGTEFQGYFADNVNGSGTVIFPTDARAPWQNGKTERAGGLWKDQLWASG